MKPFPLTASLVYSVAILSLAVLVGSFSVEVGVSYGWIEHFYRDHYFIYSTISSVAVLLGGIVLTNAIISGTLPRSGKSYLPLLLYSSVLSLATGEYFLYISVAGLFMVFVFAVIILKSRNPEPLSGFIFKMVLVVFLLMLFHPAMVWLILPIMFCIIYFRPSIAKDLSVLFLSFLLFAIYLLWCKWFFDLDLSMVIDDIWPRFSVRDSVLSDFVAIGMIVFVLGSWLSFKNRMLTMDSMACKLEQYSLFCIFLQSVIMLVLGSQETLIPLYATPVSFIVYIHRESLQSRAVKKLIIAIFYLVLAAIAGSMLYLSDTIQTFQFFPSLCRVLRSLICES